MIAFLAFFLPEGCSAVFFSNVKKMKWYHEASLSVIFCDLSKGQTSPKKPQSPNASNNPKKPDIAPKAKICPKLPRKAKSTLDCPKGIKVKL